jgi:hypothetical protein
LKTIMLTLFLLVAVVFSASAQTSSLLDFNQRLSVGARAYRTFDEKPGVAGSYLSQWCAGISFAHELTSPKDPAVKLPVSLMGAVDLGIPTGGQKATVRGYFGLGFQLKKAGQ